MYVNSSKELIIEFKDDIEKTYGLLPSSEEIMEGKYNKCCRIKYLAKRVYVDLKKYLDTYSTSDGNCTLPKWIMLGSISFKKIFLNKFWDNEGSISKDGKLSADLTSKKVIDQLSNLHKEFGLRHYISKYMKNGWAYKLALNRSFQNYK